MIRAVLFDRDGTLIADRPAAPETIVPMPYAVYALRRLRDRGIRIGVITNQPCIAQGTVTWDQMRATHRHIERLLGAIDDWFVCPHDAAEGCTCRKPAPGLIHTALKRFGITAAECALIGDIGSDVEAGTRAGVLSVLVPTRVTLKREILAAPIVRDDLRAAVDVVFAAGSAGAA